MSNPYFMERLRALQEQLMSGYRCTGPSSSATKGSERQIIVDELLRKALPYTQRLGSGEVCDAHGKRSGQLDIVLESPFAPSLPVLGAASRLYMAEGVSAVVEVKSDVSAQWPQVESTAHELATVRPSFGGTIGHRYGEPPRVPFFVVGFVGWKENETIRAHIASAPIDGVLVIGGGGRFVSMTESKSGQSWFTDRSLEGPSALLGLLVCLQTACQMLDSAGVDALSYTRD